MSVVIPFISQLAEQEQNEWLIRLNCELAPNKVVLAAQMNSNEKFQAEVAIVANPEPSEIAQFPNLVWIQSLWAGVERLMKDISQPRFKVARLVDPFLAQTMAEAVLTWSLFLHRQIPQYSAQQKRCEWQQHPVVAASERNIGFLGLGQLGQVSAQRLKDNGFNVSGWSLSAKTLSGISCYSGEKGLTTLLANTHILVVLLPLTKETDQLVNKVLLSKLPQGAHIINFARGRILDIEAVISALDCGQLSHAVLDVFEHEPLPPSDTLWRHEKVSILPHISAPTNKATASKIVRHNIFNYLQQGILPQIVDIKRKY